MKVVKSGASYNIFGTDITVTDKFLPRAYAVRFNEQKGFYLIDHPEIIVGEEKVYGPHEKKVHKVLNAFKKANRSLGVILHGEKGMGKTLFTRVLSNMAIAEGYPVIVVENCFDGLAQYIQSIEQEVVVLFDEFDKNFSRSSLSSTSPQHPLLGLFDGLSQSKKMYVVTCNDISNISSYLIDRPGRFKYRICFDSPSRDEIKEYLNDKLDPDKKGEINMVLALALRSRLNYDCLRVIVEELNDGLSFAEAVEDLNICSSQGYLPRYDLMLHYANGCSYACYNVAVDVMSNTQVTFWFGENISGSQFIKCRFDPSKAAIDADGASMYVDASDIVVVCYDEDEQGCESEIDKCRSSHITGMTMTVSGSEERRSQMKRLFARFPVKRQYDA